ncbi:MAG: PspC domain-containing protein, partial [Dongiaceae bacterium]
MPLQLSNDDKMIAGVCGGLAKWIGWDSTLVRFLYVVISICSAAFPGIIVYILL